MSDTNYPLTLRQTPQERRPQINPTSRMNNTRRIMILSRRLHGNLKLKDKDIT